MASLLSAHRRWALASVSGLLNGAAFIDHGALSLIANVPLLWALTRSKSATESAGLGALVGFLGGIHIYGVLNYGWFLFLAFSFYTASQMVIYALILGFSGLRHARGSMSSYQRCVGGSPNG